MKTVGLGMVFIICSLFGLWVDLDERKRIKELETLIYLFERLKGEIDYQLTPLREACIQITKSKGEGVHLIFLSFAEELQSEQGNLQIMWQKALDKNKPYLHLNKEDYEIISTFGSNSVYLDKNMEKRNLEMVIERLEECYKEAKAKYKKCSKLNRSLGVLIGGALVIFLI